MRRAFVVVLLGSALAAIAIACGLNIEGSKDPAATVLPDGTVLLEASLPDGGEAIDDGIEAAALGIPIGPVEEPSLDAGLDAPVTGDCGSPVVADKFNTSAIAGTWLTYGGAAEGFENVFGGVNGFVRLIPTGQGSKAAGIFTLPKVSASSFVATFRYFAQQPSGQGLEGDGFTFAWLTSPAAMVNNSTLADAVSGGGLGMPKTLAGFAFVLDSYTNSSLGDPSAPGFSILHMDPTKGAPGGYNWHIKNSPQYTGVYDTWRTVTATLDKGKLTVDVDTAHVFANESVPSAPITAIGFTAATGGVGAIGFNIDTVQIEFKEATCP